MNDYKILGLVTIAATALTSFSMRPELGDTPTFWVVIVGGYLLLAVSAVVALSKSGDLRGLLQLRGGDVTLGIVSGLVLTGSALFVLRYVSPLSTPRGAWLLTLYAQVGNIQGELWATLGLVGVVVCEELVWRGLVLTRCERAWGPKVAAPASALLYTCAQLPTLVTLAVPGVGYNPLLVLGAISGGLLWGGLAILSRRLAPVVVCHLVFSYFVASPTPEWLF